MIPNVNGTFTKQEGGYFLPERFALECPDFEPWCVEAFCQRTGSQYETVSSGGDIRITKNAALPLEGYQLEIAAHGVTIEAAAERGVVWALATLCQLIEGRSVPCCSILDSPRFSHRGVMLDCVRHFFPADEVKRIIDELSRFKLNVFHWHLTDDQGFRIESKKFPELHQQCGADYYTQAEIKEIVEHARVRGVEVIPEMNMPGHTTAILAVHPELGCQGKAVKLGRSGGIYPIPLCPGREETYRFLKDLLDEVCPLFPSKRFHMGGDETPDWEWQACPHCKAKMEGLGLTDTRQLQGYFSNRVKKLLRGHGKEVICWNDSLMASNFQAQDAAVQYWSIQYAGQTLDYLARGGKLIYSDMFEIYLDYPSAMSSMKKVYHCAPAIRGQAIPVEGLEACLWTEYVDSPALLEQRLFPRAYALAENAWCGEKDYKGFLERLGPALEDVARRGISSQTAMEADPHGEMRKQGIMEHTARMQNGMDPELRELAIKFTQPGEEFQARFMEQFFGPD